MVAPETNASLSDQGSGTSATATCSHTTTGRWIKRHRLEAVVSNWTNTLNALHASGGSSAADPEVVELATEPEQSLFGGMLQRDSVVGESAMEQLAMLLKTNQTGCIDKPNRILIPGQWIDGTQSAARSRAARPRETLATGA